MSQQSQRRIVNTTPKKKKKLLIFTDAKMCLTQDESQYLLLNGCHECHKWIKSIVLLKSTWTWKMFLSRLMMTWAPDSHEAFEMMWKLLLFLWIIHGSLRMRLLELNQDFSFPSKLPHIFQSTYPQLFVICFYPVRYQVCPESLIN